MIKMDPNDFVIGDINIGQEYSFTREVNQSLIDDFAIVSGDHNPLHTDPEYAKTSKYGENIAHGMLLASFFSELVGMKCPGLRSLFLSQDLKFRKEVKSGEVVTVVGRVSGVSKSTSIITIKTMILNSKKQVVVDGEARVKILQ